MIKDIEFLDDNTRPKADKLEITSDRQRDGGRHLKMIHDHFRDHMNLLRKVLDMFSFDFGQFINPVVLCVFIYMI